MFLVSFALAQDLPWECALVVEPTDALPYSDALSDDTTGVEEAAERAMAIAEAWVDASCLTDCSGGLGTCFTGACTTAAGAWVEYDYEATDGSSGYTTSANVVTHIVVEPPSEPWTRLEVTEERSSSTYSSTTSSEWTSWSASWAGVLDADWPEDGSFLASSSAGSGSSEGSSVTWDDGDCAWEASHSSDTMNVTVMAVEVGVSVDYSCGPWRFLAYIDGAYYGNVDGTTWALLEDADGDLYAGDSDCDDADATAHWCATEVPYDGIDQDCSGADESDVDNDGYEATAAGGDDCDDADRGAHPGAVETAYDGIDQDCDGLDLTDVDGDGWDHPTDCDDTDAAVNPAALEAWYDGADSDCAGDDDFDQDADGFVVADDCDDTDAAANPAALEAWYDGVDRDCAGDDDFDQDADGFVLADDCDDTDAAVNPAALEAWYDGADRDCAGDGDFDQDADGFVLADDCDDTDAAVNPAALEAWYDGVDSDCAGDGDFDQDADGFVLADDCDDTDAAVNPGAVDIVADGVDQDCDGADSVEPSEAPTRSSGCSTAPRAPEASGLLVGAILARRRKRPGDSVRKADG